MKYTGLQKWKNIEINSYFLVLKYLFDFLDCHNIFK